MTQTFLEAKGFAPVSITPPPAINTAPIVPVEVDEEYKQWKRDMGLDVPLTAQQIEDIYTYELSRC